MFHIQPWSVFYNELPDPCVYECYGASVANFACLASAMTNLCRDEVTAVLKEKIESVFGSSFNTNGLGGVLTCGVTGMSAGLSHSPVSNVSLQLSHRPLRGAPYRELLFSGAGSVWIVCLLCNRVQCQLPEIASRFHIMESHNSFVAVYSCLIKCKAARTWLINAATRRCHV